jgi:hypothetical protein
MPIWLQTLSFLGMLGMPGGVFIACFVFDRSWKALKGELPWIMHRGMFVASFVISGSIMAAFASFMIRSFFRWAV